MDELGLGTEPDSTLLQGGVHRVDIGDLEVEK